MVKCPVCNSDNYGFDLDERTNKEYWYCLDCGSGIDRSDDNREYRAQYDYACGYHD